MTNARRRVPNRKFKNSEPLRLALLRSKIEHSGAASTLLLEAFIEDSGRLTASKVVSRGLCQEGEFSQWRRKMVDGGWIVWSEIQSDKGQYFPGKKLIGYINKEKVSSKEIVTKDEVIPKEEAATKAELQELKIRMNRIEDAVAELQKTYEPPETEEKRAARERAANRLSQLAQKKAAN